MKRGVFLICAVMFAVARVARADEPATNPADAGRTTVVIKLAGEVDDYNRDELMRQFAEARRLNAKVVILNIDTYGGLLTSGLDISRFIKRQDDLHVIAYVEDKAISAGAMIAMACDEIVMSDSASLGDCAPIIFGPEGLEAMPAAERAKAEAPVLLDFHESAIRNHRDPLLAAKMVDVSRVVYWVQNDKGERRFVDQEDYDKLTATKQWVAVPDQPSPIAGSSILLAVDSDQAVAYGLASQKASSIDALASQRGYHIVADLSPGLGDNVVEILSGWIARGILIVVFLQCLYVVLHMPGHGVAEVVGLIALVLMLGIPLLTGYAQWWEILVIFIGLLMVSFEILLPGHWFPGIIGGLLVMFGLVMTFVPAGPGGPLALPNRANWPLMERGTEVVAAAMASSLVLWVLLGRILPSTPVLNRLILTATSGNKPVVDLGDGSKPAPDRWPPPGAVGTAVTELKPGGSAEFFDPAISDKRVAFVISASGFVAPGTEVVVREFSGPSVVVRKREG